MSNAVMTLVQARTFGSPYRKAVALILADRASDDGYTYVGQERIANESEVAVRTVRKILAEFEDEGLIARKRRFDAKGHRTSDGIYWNFETLQSLPAHAAARPIPTGTGEIPTGTPVQSLPARGAGEPSVEPSEETFIASPAKIKTNGHLRPPSYCPPDVRAKAIKALGIRE